MPEPSVLNSASAPEWVAVVRKAAGSVRFGYIQIKIHDGEVVQIEATEKYRLDDFSPQPLSSPTGRPEANPTQSSNARPTRTLADVPRS